MAASVNRLGTYKFRGGPLAGQRQVTVKRSDGWVPPEYVPLLISVYERFTDDLSPVTLMPPTVVYRRVRLTGPYRPADWAYDFDHMNPADAKLCPACGCASRDSAGNDLAECIGCPARLPLAAWVATR